MAKLMIGKVNVVDYFDNPNVYDIYVTTESLDGLDFDMDFEQVLEFGIKQVVTEPFYAQWKMMPYDDITAAKIVFNDDSFAIITPSGVKGYDYNDKGNFSLAGCLV